MALIQRGIITEELRNGLDLDSVRTGQYPNQTSDKIVLTYDYSNVRYADIVKSISAVNSTSQTLYTTPVDQDFYLTSAQISVIKDVTATSLVTALTVVTGGTTNSVLSIRGLTLTVQSEAVSISFPTPIKLDRNSNINLTCSTNVANISAGACISGYVVK